MFVVGFDVGGTKIEAALIQFEQVSLATFNGEVSNSSFPYHSPSGKHMRGKVFARSRLPTERSLGYDQIVHKMTDLVGTVCKQSNVEVGALHGLGFAIPGSVCPKTLRMLNGNTLVLKNQNFTVDVLNALGKETLKVHAENDGNCFALAEALCGVGTIHAQTAGVAARSLSSVGIILGTGCGGGIVIQGNTLRGRRGGGGEVGHILLKEGGLSCYCGQRGCAEQYMSGTGLEQSFNARRYSQVQEFQSARNIFSLAESADPIAVAVINEFKEDLSKFLAGLSALFDPDFFVLGGGVSLQNSLYQGLEEATCKKSFLKSDSVPIYRNALGDSAGVVGAALLVVKDQV